MLPYLSTCKCFLCKWQRERPKNLEDHKGFRKARRKHKKKYGEALSRDFFQYYHKRQYYVALRDELMCIAWHPKYDLENQIHDMNKSNDDDGIGVCLRMKSRKFQGALELSMLLSILKKFCLSWGFKNI